MNRYQQLAQKLAEQIRSHQFSPGERITSTRQLAQQHRVSMGTVQRAQQLLEDWGLIEARPRSGYFVRGVVTSALADDAPLPSLTTHFEPTPSLVRNQKMVLELVQRAAQPEVLQLGATLPDPFYLPVKALQKSLSATLRKQSVDSVTSQGVDPQSIHKQSIHQQRFDKRRIDPQLINYQFPPGSLALRQQLARRMALSDCVIKAEDLVITNGCHEALLLALKAVTQPGDIVALESPTYYGLLQVIESLHLKALEIPTDPQQGVSLEALSLACEQWPIKACVLVSNFSNPLGSIASPSRKKDLVELLADHQVPLIEDDVYGDLSFDGRRPAPLKSFDQTGNVIYCNSFSKTIAPGMRVGWIAPGRHLEQVTYLKFIQSLASPSLEQSALAHFLEHGHYDRHLRKIQAQLGGQVNRIRETLLGHFPSGTQVTQPKGGFVLWVILPASFQASVLHQKALQHNISIAPGELFTNSNKYQNCFRINAAIPWSKRLHDGLILLSELVKSC